MADWQVHEARSQALADSVRRYLVAAHAGGITAVFALAGALSTSKIHPKWAVVPVLIFSFGLTSAGVSMLLAQHREMRRRDAVRNELAEPKFGLVWWSWLWNWFGLAALPMAVIAALFQLGWISGQSDISNPAVAAVQVLSLSSGCPPVKPHWTAYMTAIIVPVIALIAAWIAFRQSEIARRKLKLDLFERRMQVYEVARKTIGVAVRGRSLKPEEEFEYLSGVRSAKWLFDDEVSEYLETTLWEKFVDLDLHNRMSSSPDPQERVPHVQLRSETLRWLMAQFKELDARLAAYLRLGH